MVRRGMENGRVVLLARSGQGKSTLVAQILAEYEKEGSVFDVVHAVFIGSVEGSTILFRMLTDLCRALLADLERFDLWNPEFPKDTGGFPNDELGLSGLFACVLKELTDAGKKVLICFDALNELDGATARSLTFLPQRTAATILMTTIMEDASTVDSGVMTPVREVCQALERRFEITASSNSSSENAIVLPDLSEREQHELASHFTSTEITPAAAAALRTKSGRASPLYLRLSAPYLDTLASDPARFPGDVAGLYDWLLERLLSAPAKESGGVDVKTLMTSVAVSGGALFTCQLKELQQFHSRAQTKPKAKPKAKSEAKPKAKTPLFFSAPTFRHVLSLFLRAIPVQGSTNLSRVSFVHMQADHTIQRKWLSTQAKMRDAHSVILAYLLEKYRGREQMKKKQHSAAEEKQKNNTGSDNGDTDPMLLWDSVLSGLPRHFFGVGDQDNAAKWMCTSAYCIEKLNRGHLSELIQDFRRADKLWPVGSTGGFVDFLEMLRANAHVLRMHPSSFFQQAMNARDDSAARQSVSSSNVVQTSSLLIWKNKFNGKPSNVCTFENRALLFWCADAKRLPNGQTLFAAGGSDCCVHLLDDIDGNETSVLPPHASDVDRVIFAPNTDEFVLSSAAGPGQSGTEIFLCSTHSCTLLGQVVRPGHVYDLCWSDQSSHFCAAEGYGFVIGNVEASGLMEITNLKWEQPERRQAKRVVENEEQEGEDAEQGGEEEEEEDDGYGACRCCVFAPKSSTFVAVGCGAFVIIVNAENNEAVTLEGRHEEDIITIDWCRVPSSAADLLATGALDSSVRVWSRSQKKCLCVVRCHEDVVHCVRFAHDGKSLLSASEDRKACETVLVDALGSSHHVKCCAKLRGHSSAVKSVQPLSGEGRRRCFTVGDDGTLRVWDLDRAKIETFESLSSGSGRPITASIWMKDGTSTLVVCGDSEGTLTAYDLDGHNRVLWSSTITLSKSSHSAITDLRPSLPDRTSGAASMYLRCVVFSSKDGALLHALVMEDWVNTVAIGLSGRFVIGGGDASCLFVQWLHDDDGGSRKNYRMEWSTSDLPASNVLALALCPSEPTLLAAGGNGCVLSLWRLGKDAGELLANSSSDAVAGWIVSCAFCKGSSNRLVVCRAGRQGCVSLMQWDRASSMIASLAHVLPKTPMSWCGVVADTGVVVTASATKLIHMWSIQETEEGGGAAAFALMSLFPAKARFGSPDGIGGAGDLMGDRIAIGDEAGSLYIVEMSY
jgi:WD40 repeat protein